MIILLHAHVYHMRIIFVSCMCSLDSMATCSWFYVPDKKRIDDSVPVGFERHSLARFCFSSHAENTFVVMFVCFQRSWLSDSISVQGVEY